MDEKIQTINRNTSTAITSGWGQHYKFGQQALLCPSCGFYGQRSTLLRRHIHDADELRISVGRSQPGKKVILQRGNIRNGGRGA